MSFKSVTFNKRPSLLDYSRREYMEYFFNVGSDNYKIQASLYKENDVLLVCRKNNALEFRAVAEPNNFIYGMTGVYALVNKSLGAKTRFTKDNILKEYKLNYQVAE